jgi:hypothetical protein
MSFNSKARLLLRFTDDALLDSVSGKEFLVGGAGSVTVADSGGYQMKRDQYLYSPDASLGVTGEMTVGFWLLPNNPGMAQHPVSKAVEAMQMPVLEIGHGLYDATNATYTPQSVAVLITERAIANGRNEMVIALTDATTGLIHTITTASYVAGIWHHFWIAWNGSTVSVFLDGKAAVVSASGTIPATLNAFLAGIWVNRQSLTPNYNVLRNGGVIDDLAILNTAENTASVVQEAVNLSIDFVLDGSYSSLDEVDYTILFDDPTAVKITGMCDDGSFLYVAQTDGRLLQGSPLLWQSRREYSGSGESDVLKKFGSGITVADGYLKITDGTVRL